MTKRIIALRCLFILLILLNCYVIFLFSSENGSESTNTSMDTMKRIIRIVEKDENKVLEKAEKMESILRKIAHFTIYTSLGIWNMCLMETLFDVKDDNCFKVKVILAVVFGCLYAISDEFHQVFVSARSGSIRDVFLDTMGVTNGALIVEIIVKIRLNHGKRLQ